MKKYMPMIIFLFAVVQLVTVIGIVFYFMGYKQFGSPAAYKQAHLDLMQARLDSLEALERDLMLPENVADSTLFRVGRHTGLFEEIKSSEKQLKDIQSALDSLALVRNEIAQKEQAIDQKLLTLESMTNIAQQENIRKLAQMYDGMKPQQSVPLFIAMNDTTAISILSLMTQRNASKLLGALAVSDIEKATRLNRMLASTGD
ncbi:MotE family protein [Candidatus Latescibacterota bacterium]